MSATLVSVNERLNNSQYDESIAEVTMVREFIVVLSASDLAGADIAANATGIPAKGDQWPNVLANRVNPVCKRKRARLLDEKLRTTWLVECEYSNAPDVVSSASSTTNPIPPWQESPIYTYDFIEYSTAMEVDKDGVLVVNSAKDVFAEMPEAPRSNRKVTITRTTLDFNPVAAATLQDTTNTDAIEINGETIAENMARMLRWTAQTGTYTNPTTGVETPIYEETIEIEIAKYDESEVGKVSGPFPRGFLVPIVDAGFRYWTGVVAGTPDDFTSAVRHDFLDDEDEKEIGFLDGHGGKIDITDPADSTFVVKHFRAFSKETWSAHLTGI